MGESLKILIFTSVTGGEQILLDRYPHHEIIYVEVSFYRTFTIKQAAFYYEKMQCVVDPETVDVFFVCIGVKKQELLAEYVWRRVGKSVASVGAALIVTSGRMVLPANKAWPHVKLVVDSTLDSLTDTPKNVCSIGIGYFDNSELARASSFAVIDRQ